MAPQISVILPTLSEADNLPLLIPRVAKALAARTYEIVVVDDNSPDTTPETCARLALDYPVRLIVRKNPRNGLSGAVLEGMAAAAGEYLVVMDADLQHPPECVPALLEPLERNTADFALGSRYVPGASMQDTWGPLRKLNSWGATLLARPFAKRASDPMSGFFALRRSTYQQARRLTPIGYKIGLELMYKCRVERIAEIPIHFGSRAKGESKLTLRQQFRYLEHLSRLYDFTFPRSSAIAKFLIVVACSWSVAALVAWALCAVGLGQGLSILAAYPSALAVVALFHARHVSTQREFIVTARPWRDFGLIALAEWVTCAGAVVWTAWRLDHAGPVESFLLAFGSATVVRYVLRKELFQDIRGLRRELRREEFDRERPNNDME
ncbi:MAG TPA: polyprenol monophosphomannose synthase [Candidatus Methylomirabilis sp.]|nr:polyprenol monophosphomannose synthase [Candidatus Methylomirabilis sp.]